MKYSMNRVSLAVASAFALAIPFQAEAADNRIENVQVSQSGGTVVLRVDMQKPLTKELTGFAMTNPSKISLDFPDTSNGLGKSAQAVNEGALRSLNVIEAGERTRMVLNLSGNMQYQTRHDGKSIYVTLTDTGAGAPVAQSTGKAVPVAIEDIMFRRGRDGEARIVVDLNTPLAKVDVKQQGSFIVAEFPKAMAPDHLLRKLDVNDFATPVTSIETRIVGDKVQLKVSPKGKWEHNSFQNGGQFVLEVRKQVEDPNKLAQGSRGQYNGPKVSVNYHNGEVRAMIRMMAEELGLNAVISDTVQGNTTLVLKDVPADQVLDILFDQKGLEMRKSGNVITIAPREELAAKDKVIYDAHNMKQKNEPTVRESFSLSYHKAVDLVKLLNGVSVAGPGQTATAAPAAAGAKANVSRILSENGSAVADGPTNTLFVNDTPAKLDEIRDFIKKVDVAARQVQIEARVVEANDKFNRNLGMRLGWLSGSSNQIGKSGVYAGGGSYSASGQSTNTAGVGILPTGVAQSGLLAFSLFNASLSNILNLEVAAMDAEGAGKVLSNPRVVTSNNVRAKIEDGSEIPVTTPGSANSPPTVVYRDAKLSLDVVPQITPDGEVKMKIIIKKEEPNWSYSVQGNPEIKSSIIETEATVANGGTLMIGGVFRSSNDTNTDKVPLLGDVPYFGWLFKYQEKATSVRELIIFITPKVIDNRVEL